MLYECNIQHFCNTFLRNVHVHYVQSQNVSDTCVFDKVIVNWQSNMANKMYEVCKYMYMCTCVQSHNRI